MPRFDGYVDTRNLPGKRWLLLESISYQTDVIFGLTITVPKGYVTDNYSIPSWIPFVPRLDEEPGPAIVHDWIYYNKGCVGDRVVSREQADEILKEAMKVCSIWGFRCWYFHRAVRLNISANDGWKKEPCLGLTDTRSYNSSMDLLDN